LHPPFHIFANVQYNILDREKYLVLPLEGLWLRSTTICLQSSQTDISRFWWSFI